MREIEFILPIQLYNIINRKDIYTSISDPNFLLLLDARKRESYNESHILFAKHCKMNKASEFQVPPESELECKQNVVVYDNSTSNLKECGYAYACSKMLYEMGSRNVVKILRGGYELFSALYPFMRSQKLLWSPIELDNFQTYPIEVIPNFLYIGNITQARTAYIQKELKITAHVNCTQEMGSFFNEIGKNIIQVYAPDSSDTDMYPFFAQVSTFIQQHKNRGRVLIYSDKGMSRSAAFCMGYLMYDRILSLKEASDFLKESNPWTEPYKSYIEALIHYEDDVFNRFEAEAEKSNEGEDSISQPVPKMPRTTKSELFY